MLRAKSRTIPIEDIKVPFAFEQTTPGREKVEKAKQFYAVTGQFDHSILVDKNGYIFDGYARFTAAKEMGMSEVPVVQIVPFQAKKKEEKPTEDKPKFKVGDKVKIIGTRFGRTGAEGLTGVITEEPNTNGLMEYDPGINVQTDKGVWRVNSEAVVLAFDWGAFKAGKIAVHCDTKEKAKEFVQKCREHLPRKAIDLWESRETNWYIYKEDTCYKVDTLDGMLCYGPKCYSLAEGHTIIDYPFSEKPEAPTEQKEPIKLYCVKDWKSGEWLAKGKVYETDEHGRFVYEDGSTTVNTFANVKDVMRSAIGNFLVPLVKRPAKVGEWIYVTENPKDDDHGDYRKGEIYEVKKLCGTGKYVEKKPGDHPCSLKNLYQLLDDEYLVLDGYHPEPEKEKEPEYWNGEVICIEDGEDNGLTVGAKYAVTDGYMHWNSGNLVDGRFTSPDAINEYFACPERITHAKFIKYQGEAT